MKEKRMLVIIFYIFYSFSTDLLTKYLGEIGLLTENLGKTIDNLFTIVEFTCFSLFFYFTLARSIIRRMIIATIAAFILYCITNYFLQFNKYATIDTTAATFQAIFMMTLCIFYFFEQMRNPNSLFIYSTSEFWVVTGILLYLAGNFFLFIYNSNLTDKELDLYWTINYIFNTIKNILFGLALFIHGRKNRNPNEDDSFYYDSLLENPSSK